MVRVRVRVRVRARVGARVGARVRVGGREPPADHASTRAPPPITHLLRG